MGVIIYQMLVGKTPYKGCSELVTFDNISNNRLKMPESMHSDAKDLIGKLLKIDPEERLGASDLEDLMQHSFF